MDDYTKRQTVPQTSHGNNYQIHASMYFALIYAFTKEIDFILHTEDLKYGDFDDLIIIQPDKVTAIQLKHRLDSSSRYELSYFISEGGSGKELMFYKYFNSLYEEFDSADFEKNSFQFMSNIELPEELNHCLDIDTGCFSEEFFSSDDLSIWIIRNLIYASIEKHSEKITHIARLEIKDYANFLLKFIELTEQDETKHYVTKKLLNDIFNFIKNTSALNKKRFTEEEKLSCILVCLQELAEQTSTLSEEQFDELKITLAESAPLAGIGFSVEDLAIANFSISKGKIEFFLRKISFNCGEFKLDAIKNKIQSLIKEKYKTHNSAIYYAFFHEFYNWLISPEAKSLNRDAIKKLFDHWHSDYIQFEQLIGISTDNLQTRIVNHIQGIYINRLEAMDTIDNYINNEDKQVLIISGQSGIGKSALIKHYIKNHEKTYSIDGDVLVLTTDQLTEVNCNLLPNSYAKLIVLDRLEYLLQDTDKINQLETLIAQLYQSKKKVILITQEEGFEEIKKVVFGLNYKHYLLKPLTLEQIKINFPSLESYLKNEAFQPVLSIPEYLAMAVREQTNLEIDPDMDADAVKDYLIHRSLSDKNKELAHIKLTTLKKIAYSSLQISKPLDQLPNKMAIGAKNLRQKNILIPAYQTTDTYLIRHDIYLDWAIEQLIADNFISLETQEKLKNFLDFPSLYHLAKWCNRNINQLIPYLSFDSVSTLTEQEFNSLLFILQWIDINQIEQPLGTELGEMLIAIWNKYSNQQKPSEFIETLKKYFSYLSSDFQYNLLESAIQNCQGYLTEEQEIFLKLMLMPFDCGPICKQYPGLVLALIKTYQVDDSLDGDTEMSYSLDYPYDIRKMSIIAYDNLIPSPISGPWYFLLKHHGIKVLEPIIDFINVACMGYVKRNHGKQIFIKQYKDDLIKEIHFNVNNEIRIIYGDKTLWSLYRVQSNAPIMLHSALMAIECWLYEQINDKDIIQDAWDIIIEQSKTVATIAILPSVALYTITKSITLNEQVLELLKIREFYEWDFLRRFDEERYSFSFDRLAGYLSLSLSRFNLDLDIVRKKFDELLHRQYDLEDLTLALQMYKILPSMEGVQKIIDRHVANLPQPLINDDDYTWKLKLYRMDLRKLSFTPNGVITQLDEELLIYQARNKLGQAAHNFQSRLFWLNQYLEDYYKSGNESLHLLDLINSFKLFIDNQHLDLGLESIVDLIAQIEQEGKKLFDELSVSESQEDEKAFDETINNTTLNNIGGLLALALLKHELPNLTDSIKLWCYTRLCQAVARRKDNTNSKNSICGFSEGEALAAETLPIILTQIGQQDEPLYQQIKDSILTALLHSMHQIKLTAAFSIKIHLSKHIEFVTDCIQKLFEAIQIKAYEFDNSFDGTRHREDEDIFDIIKLPYFKNIEDAPTLFRCALALAASDYCHPYYQNIFNKYIDLLISQKKIPKWFEHGFNFDSAFILIRPVHLVVEYLLSIEKSASDSILERMHKENQHLSSKCFENMAYVVVSNKALINRYLAIINQQINPKHINNWLFRAAIGNNLQINRQEIYQLNPTAYQEFFMKVFANLNNSLAASRFYDLLEYLPTESSEALDSMLESIYQLLKKQPELLDYHYKNPFIDKLNQLIASIDNLTHGHVIAKIIELLPKHEANCNKLKQELLRYLNGNHSADSLSTHLGKRKFQNESPDEENPKKRAKTPSLAAFSNRSNDNAQALRERSASGNDTNLDKHGNQPGYFYSVTDGITLLFNIRQKKLTYTDSAGQAYPIKGSEEYGSYKNQPNDQPPVSFQSELFKTLKQSNPHSFRNTVLAALQDNDPLYSPPKELADITISCANSVSKQVIFSERVTLDIAESNLSEEKIMQLAIQQSIEDYKRQHGEFENDNERNNYLHEFQKEWQEEIISKTNFPRK